MTFALVKAVGKARESDQSTEDGCWSIHSGAPRTLVDLHHVGEARSLAVRDARVGADGELEVLRDRIAECLVDRRQGVG